MNVCVRCGDEYEPYHVIIPDNFADIAEHVEVKNEWNLHEGDNDGFCKACRMAVTSYGAYLFGDEREELEPKYDVNTP